MHDLPNLPESGVRRVLPLVANF